MNGADLVLLFLAMGAVTYLPRMLPLVVLSRRQLPAWFAEWLEMIPVAILSALLAPVLFTHPDPRAITLGKPELWATLPTLLFALKTRSLAGTVLVGMACYWGLGYLLPLP